jgi:hypothetical protein
MICNIYSFSIAYDTGLHNMKHISAIIISIFFKIGVHIEIMLKLVNLLWKLVFPSETKSKYLKFQKIWRLNATFFNVFQY